MKKFGRISRFTMLEVVVALAILSLSLGGLLSLLISARGRVLNSYEKWRNMHMLTQGAEYVLLHSQNVEAVPQQFFPWDDYRIVISYEDAQGLPEQESEPAGQLDLEACTIELIDLRDGHSVDKLIVDRIRYDEALEEAD